MKKQLLSLGAGAIAFASFAGITSASAEETPVAYEDTVIATSTLSPNDEMAYRMFGGTDASPLEFAVDPVATSAVVPVLDSASLAAFLGIDQDTLAARLADGATLASIAADAGVTRDDLRSFLLADYTAGLAAQVVAETITQEEAEAAFVVFIGNIDLLIDGYTPVLVAGTGIDLSVHPGWIGWE